ncbi:MAG: MEDS domain-containing protein [Chloroflexia bacterium]
MPKTIASLEPGDHLCCLYETEEEHRAVVTPFLRQGLERREKALCIVDAHTVETILDYLRDDGVAVEPYLASGQLALPTVDGTYIQQGRFDPERMIGFLEAETQRALGEGYAALRVTGEMTGVLRGRPGCDRLIEYEARLNTFFSSHRCLAICQYDRRRFEPALLLDVLVTHPFVVVGTTVHRNLYYIPPAEFLGADRAAAELRHRLRNLEVRSQVDEMLRQSELRFRGLVRESLDGIALTDDEGRVVEWNRTMERITGLAAAAVLGRPLWEVWHGPFPVLPHTPGEAVHLKDEITQCLRLGWAPWVGRVLEGEYRRPDGTKRFVQGVMFPVREGFASVEDPERAGQGLVVSLVDVTEREELREQVLRYAAEQEERVACCTAELRATQQDYLALVNSIDGIVWELDVASFRFLFVSQQAERLLGYPVERWLNEPNFWQEHLHSDDREWVLAFCAQATLEKRDHEIEYRMLAADGRTVWLRDIVTVVVEDGRPVKLRGVMVDITAQKEMQAALLQSERLAAMGQLAATLAHEINNPLQSVIGCLDLASEGLADGRDISRYLQIAREEVQRLRRIVGQMRAVYRPERDDREPTDLNRLVEEVVALCSQTCRAANIVLAWEPGADLPLLPVAPDRIKQVFLNLLLNAIEAMPGGGELRIRTARTRQPEGVRIEFWDQGPGVSPEVLPHLFEPFHSTKPGGSGLGLFVSYRVAKEHGGTITVESQPGKGTTFTVWLPLEVAERAEGADQRTGERYGRGRARAGGGR